MLSATVYSIVFVFFFGGVLAFAWNGLSFLAVDTSALSASWIGLLLLIASAFLSLSITLFLRRLDPASRRYSALEREVLQRQARRSPKPKIKPPSAAELKAIRELGLNARAAPADIRGKYVVLIRKYHPDTNGGDRSREVKLGQTVRAYRQLCRSGRA